MQKLDFTYQLETISKLLRSADVVRFMNEIMEKNTNPFHGVGITSILLESKSNYDSLAKEESFKSILGILNSAEAYETQRFSEMINEVHSRKSTFEIFYRSLFSSFYAFHSGIMKMNEISRKAFFDDTPAKREDDLETGYIILEILTDQPLDLDGYLKVLDLLRDLVEALSKSIFPQDTPSSPKILLLDSGSSTNLGIQTGIETAKSLFLMFKEVWDWIVNKKFYEQHQENQALLENLAVIRQIKEHQEAGYLTDDEGKELTHKIKTRVFDLVDLNVLPKTITKEKFESSHKDILLNYREIKKLNPPSG